MIPWLNDDAPFPPVSRALRSPNGLLAAGGDLSAARLLEAYRLGIFPWFNPGEPILWWSPDPRMVLIPGEFKTSRSLAKELRNGAYEVRFDSAFEEVMRACAAPRDAHHGTWIGEEMIAAYCALHQQGYAHSVEVWMEGKLAGGLYGVGIGRVFYGESMFSRISNASKIALAHLAAQLARWQYGMIDCQMKTTHLASLGAREIPRSEFIARLQELVHCTPTTNWRFESDLFHEPA
ncbi:MAG: leucyl/phenylalanyl-tRNA--protein transferase [Gallionella sp.]